MRTRLFISGFIVKMAAAACISLPLLAAGTSKTEGRGAVVPQAIQVGNRKAITGDLSGMPASTTAEIIAVRNLDSEHVFRDLEIEVRNNSTKPIYYMDLDVTFPDFETSELDGVSRRIGTILEYGRDELYRLTELAVAGDVPIKLGETQIFKIPETNWKAYEKILAGRNTNESIIKTISIRIHTVNFGDGTGYKVGIYFSNKQTSMNSPKETPSLQAASYQIRREADKGGAASYSELPASLQIKATEAVFTTKAAEDEARNDYWTACRQNARS